MTMIRAIAIHLPQFHPFPENDAWWGRGFTEWTNVAKAKPLFKDHYQPHIPSDLGFYDLRLEESRVEQAKLAKQYGIDGFCYYHYWFNGKRLLNRPLDDMLKTKTPDFPFMLSWANENWTRRWDGLDEEILIKQNYNLDDDIKHIRFLCKNFFTDPRYIRVGGKPFFVVYRPALIPDIQRTLCCWREEAHRIGIGELYLGYFQRFGMNTPPHQLGFDCAIEFHPDFHTFNKALPITLEDKILMRIRKKKSPYLENSIMSYKMYVDHMIEKKITPDVLPGITPMWDNSARRKSGAYIFKDSSPEEYGRWLEQIFLKYKTVETDNKFIFINAWNEWAEGNHLEPCQKWGRRYLEKTKEIIYKFKS